jgi:protein tyrosine phosphatase (PTP) superfamily phosphohydrolase (DUF442 family)
MSFITLRGPAGAANRPPLARRLLRGAAVCLGLGLAILCFLLYIGLFWGNIRTVVPGRAYRSAQLAPDRLSEMIRAHGIRTVISLKGGNKKQRWYQRELAACSGGGATLSQIPLSASKLPEPEQVQELVRLFDESQYPILFHCKAGSDRTGLAATIYLHLKEGKSLDDAEREGLTWRYGHFPFETVAMDRFFDLYRNTARGADLRTWINRDYPSVYAETHPEYRVTSARTPRRPEAPPSGTRLQTGTLER